jgi:hypothetical protein
MSFFEHKSIGMHGELIYSIEQARKIPILSEQLFALALLGIDGLEIFWNPGSIIVETFGVTNPDFFIRNTKNPQARGTYIEVTKTNAEKFGTRKHKQQQILQASGVSHLIVDGKMLNQIRSASLKTVESRYARVRTNIRQRSEYCPSNRFSKNRKGEYVITERHVMIPRVYPMPDHY